MPDPPEIETEEEDEDGGGGVDDAMEAKMKTSRLPTRFHGRRRFIVLHFSSLSVLSPSSLMSCAVVVLSCLFIAFASSSSASGDVVGEDATRTNSIRALLQSRDIVSPRLKRSARAQTMNGSFNPHSEVRIHVWGGCPGQIKVN